MLYYRIDILILILNTLSGLEILFNAHFVYAFVLACVGTSEIVISLDFKIRHEYFIILLHRDRSSLFVHIDGVMGRERL